MRSNCDPLLLLAMTACNQAFGLDQTRKFDAGRYDAPIDAPFACPRNGSEPPTYSPFLHQDVAEDCTDYSISPAGRAVALCFVDRVHVNHVAEGSPDRALQPVIDLVPPEQFFRPRLSPDGQRMLVQVTLSSAFTVREYTRMADGSWQRGADAPFGTSFYDGISTIARGPTGDRVLVSRTDLSVHEWAHEGSTWREVLVETAGELGTPVAEIVITSDGLRAVISSISSSSNSMMFYTDRIDESSKFRRAVLLVGVTPLSSHFLTDDCARVYVTGVGSIFYAQQL